MFYLNSFCTSIGKMCPKATAFSHYSISVQEKFHINALLSNIICYLLFPIAEETNIHTHKQTYIHYTHTHICVYLMCVCQQLSHVQLFVIPQTVASQAPLSMKFSRQEYWSGFPFPSLGHLLTQRLNLSLLHFRQGDFYHLSYQGSPKERNIHIHIHIHIGIDIQIHKLHCWLM